MLKWERFKKANGIAKGTIVPAFRNAYNELEEEILKKEAEKIDSCGYFIKVLECEKCYARYFRNFSKCKSKYCPTCAALKGAIWCAKLYPLLDKWLKEKKYVCFGTFTIPAQESLAKALEIIYGAWRYMTNKLVQSEWKERFAGGVRSVEVKIGKYSGKWHVHIHALLLRAKYGRDHHFLREAWIKAVRHIVGEEIEVNMPRIESIRENPKCLKEKNKILSAICETIKYITKINHDMTSNQLLECVKLMKGRRQISCWGNLYGISKKVEREFDEDSEGAIETFLCKACGYTMADYLEIYDSTGKNWQDTNLTGDYSEVVTFQHIEEEFSDEKPEKDEEYEQMRWTFYNGIQEASGSNPLISTKNKSTEFSRCFCFCRIAGNVPPRFSACGALVCDRK